MPLPFVASQIAACFDSTVPSAAHDVMGFSEPSSEERELKVLGGRSIGSGGLGALSKRGMNRTRANVGMLCERGWDQNEDLAQRCELRG